LNQTPLNDVQANIASLYSGQVVVVNEVADKGSFGVCGGTSSTAGADWVELFNAGTGAVDLSGWKLHDNNGVSSAKTLTFPAGTTIFAGAFLLLCQSSNSSVASSFLFGVGGTDTVTLVNASGSEVSTTGVLLNLGSTVATYQHKSDGSYAYAPPTPLNVNVFSTSSPTISSTSSPTLSPTSSPTISPTSSPTLSSTSSPTISPAPVLTLSPVFNLVTVVVNEVGYKGTFNICGGSSIFGGGDYVELLNTCTTPVNLTGWKLHDNRGAANLEALIFSGTVIFGGEFILLCNGKGGNFSFDIGGDDSVTLVDSLGMIVSTNGVLQGLGSSDLSYQYKDDGSYVYSKTTPGSVNTFTLPNILINEVAFDGSINACSGTDWVELYNDGSLTVDLGNYLLHDNRGRSAVDA
jgi:Lamin Tail Domain